ncbi:hypothetical protein H072_33 [Dactylellina haptotyla CBS 200.50]|uniref:Uncharacterized protein n=1 Tax=Dactylellina haptotyla (strain CBS 200.50) TaxID=1284197 RepID=S8AY92_DACHA|nr:hypothetical protein H072_33 [Dactylellina haptotyla CBS 200.50]
MTQAQVQAPPKTSVDMRSIDLEKVRPSIESDESTIRVPFSAKKTSRKLFFSLLILLNIILIAIVVGLAVGLTLRLREGPGSSSPSSPSSTAALDEGTTHGQGAGPNRHS